MHLASLIKRPITFVIALCALLCIGGALSHADSERTLRTRYSQLAKDVSKAARGLENGLKKDDVRQAEKLYSLEMRSADLLGRIHNSKFKSYQRRDKMASSTRSVHSDILRLQERVLDHTLTELDKALPGEPARDHWAREGVDLYRPLGRSDTPDPNNPRGDSQAAVQQMLNDFAAEGGSRKDITTLGPKFLASVPSGTLVEWVQKGQKVYVTTSGAKHPVIADGASVRGAGSMMIYKDGKGKVMMAVVSNSSGNYKPGIGSVFGVGDRLEELGIPRDRILNTAILPGEPVLVKLLLKSKKTYSKEQIKSRVAKVRETSLQRLKPAKERIAARTANAGARAKPTATTTTPAKPKKPVRTARKPTNTQQQNLAKASTPSRVTQSATRGLAKQRAKMNKRQAGTSHSRLKAHKAAKVKARNTRVKGVRGRAR